MTQVRTTLGKVGLSPKGEYNAETEYARLDIISCSGSSFIILKDGVIGIAPTPDNINFMLVANKGDKGDAFTWDDFTDDQIGLIKGEKGDPFLYGDFNAEQIEDLKKPATEAAKVAKDAAAEALNVPKIQDGYFWMYDVEQKKYIKTNSPATGKSPKAIDGIWWEWNDEAGEYVSTNISASSDYELTKMKIENVLTGDVTTHSHATQLAEALVNYVRIVEGKQLSAEDFTTAFKNKLIGLENYNDTAVVASIIAVGQRIDALVGTSASDAIDTFREIEAFLQGITDTKTLTGLMSDLKTEIAALIPTKLSQLANDNNTVKDANYVHTDNNYTTADKTRLAKFNITPTLDHEPTEADLTFTDISGAHTFLVGDMARVHDAEKNEYVFWQLYDITVGNKAVWKKSGSGGDMQLTEKVNITLSSNQAQPDAALNGAVIHLKYGDNDTPLTWNNGAVLSTEVPMNMTFTIVYPTIAGYATPETAEYIALAGNTRSVNAMYNTTIMTIDVASNQTNKADLNNLQITLSGSMSKILTYTGQPLSLKVPTGKQIVITPTQIDGHATVPASTRTPNASADAVVFTYNTTVTSISLTSNQGIDTALNGLSVAVKYGSVTKNLTWQGSALSLKIPTGISYTVTTGSVTGYNTPAVKTQTATGTTGSVSMAYTTEKVTINVTADDGGNVANQTLTVTNTSNNSVIHSGKAGLGIILKIPFQTPYKVTVTAMSGYHDTVDQTFTAASASRIVSVIYDKIKTSRVVQDDAISDPANITEEVNGTIIQQIRAKFRRCLAKKSADGQMTIRYLKNDNSNFYDDGTAAILTGSEGDVMVYFPRFFYKHESLGSYKFAITYALNRLDSTWKESTECLVGAYEAYNTSSKLYSRSGVGSTGSVSQANFKSYARARGIGYQTIDYDQHKMIAWLFYAIYGTRHCQSVCGSGTNDYQKSTGQTNAIGNTDTTTANGNSMSVNFLGIENCWGNKYEWLDNVIVNNGTWVITDTVTGVSRNVVGLQTNSSWGYAKTAVAGENLDIIAKEGGMSESTGYSDGFLTTTGSSRVVLRSYNYSNAYGGVAYAYANNDASSTHSSFGSRLAFRGVVREAESVSAFKALSVTN